jgi:RNA polymerase sigma-70 factor, ECF subfamily
MTLEEEKTLIAKAQNNPEAFGRLYDEYFSQIYAYVLRRVANVPVAQDITSEVFFKALNKLGQYKWQGKPFLAWLYTITGNEIISYFRGKYKTTLPLEDLMAKYGFDYKDDEPTPAESMVNVQDSEEINSLYSDVQQRLRELPPKYQEVLSLRYFEKRTIKEISDILDTKEGTVKSLLSRGIDKLASGMSDKDATPF